ncbi:2-oxo acid dehydrogenase subunit E2 [Acinetobacter ursingii]|uniref:2-oxo acid dehydrogenase subunit E2 n=1 Tax=Acinetobacter ursingii TaxID=108980 RepID=UPI00124D5340|nr:2-oxo acid dehydrogenase subunit E2 [Acinetobacter ursingii]MCU4306100.1 2-oxo acid dehydrogenase subunit E2 [Acinetobacter ursingii]MCU4372185.1 2-oxo acid dehydrogenase subunit E2 [Acinetobacter ursingii]MCU4381873.1 2-oxo acid dehydrogenase subunit E2 [Acinetobacter ursingii]MDG9992783.1 2-oxo acid dehydrogenase subunit E2 [Acinetobacter ursingii]MDH0204905.1 2-oxo acid dehydrogenase subunit E2 [Acinetobacter ursingii]
MQVKTPDIGVEKATVAEILVKVGDQISENDSLILLESDKASVEVPSTASGVVKSILVNQGDEVTEGTALIELESGTSQSNEAAPKEQAPVQAEAAPKSTTSGTPEQAATQSMASTSSGATTVVEVQVPDIGVEKATVAELLVKVGDEISENDSLILLESDKASVEVPSPVSGTVESVAVKEGDSVKEGVLLLKVKTQTASEETTEQTATANENTVAQPVETASTTVEDETVSSVEQEISVPDLGVDKATVSEILVQVGDHVDAQQSLCVVESDKASVEVPSSIAGVVKAIHVSVGQEVKQGIALATIEGEAKSAPKAKAQAAAPAAQTSSVKTQIVTKPAEQPKVAAVDSASKLSQAQEAENAKVYAGPAVRKLARELGVILAQVKASGEHGRLMKEDIYAHVKQRMTAPVSTATTSAAPVASGLPALPDFTAFGGGEIKTMTRLQQVSVPQLSLNNFIPQVTQFDLADITELEAWRGELKDGFKKQGVSLTILAFIAKAVAHLLKEEPYFAGHLADDQKSVLLRNEIHMGIAVATPDGLTVPVLRNPDQKSIKQIAIELGELSQKARDKKLSPKDLQGANFTITSLGSIGGTAFTPLVNWPQVAILGISPATMQPVWNGKDFDPRLMLPLSLSYDHRVINGADAARFTHKLTKLLKDIRTLLI